MPPTTMPRVLGFSGRFIIFSILLTFTAVYILHLTMSLPPPTSQQQQPPRKYPSGVPDKFDPSGKVQPFPGNTLVSHLLPSAPDLQSSLEALHAKLQHHPLAHLYALLPPSSYHMTIFEGVVDSRRKPHLWPSNLPLDAPLEECNALFTRELSAFDLATPLPYRCRVAGVTGRGGLELRIEPLGEHEGALRGLRDRLAGVLGYRRPEHDKYVWHTSLAYLLRFLSEEQRAEMDKFIMDHFGGEEVEFELGAPEFCTFEDMFAFKRLFFLKNQTAGEEEVEE